MPGFCRITAEKYFYPRSPCGERHAVNLTHSTQTIFLSTLSLRRATARRALGFVDPDISIHALLAESDRGRRPASSQSSAFLSTLSLRRATIVGGAGNNAIRISIHALLAESDCAHHRNSQQTGQFLSTLSLRRATRSGHYFGGRIRHFYPRSPCGERPRHQSNYLYLGQHFYPRSPCGERLEHLLII